MRRMVCIAALAALPLAAQTVNAVEHLQRTQRMFADEVAGLTEAQWKFKPGPERWSVAECAEHITVAEGFLREMAEKAAKAPPTGEKTKVEDARVVAALTDRSFKAQAPEPLRPTTRWASREALLQEFQTRRARTIAYAAAADEAELRRHTTPSQIFGTIDAYQWVLFLSAHTERHILQMREVKADPGYPKQ